MREDMRILVSLTMTTIVPPEILDHIFSCLRSDVFTLQQCCTAHSSLNSLAERHIFHHITINTSLKPTGRDFTPQQLRGLLSSAPHIAGYIRSLRILITPPLILHWYSIRSQNDIDIAYLLPLLPNLHTISLESHLKTTRTSWLSLSPFFRAEFQRCVQRPTMRRVEVRNVDGFPVRAFDGCAYLRDIALEGSFVVDAQDPDEGEACPLLDALMLTDISPIQPLVDWATQTRSTLSGSLVSRLTFLHFAPGTGCGMDAFTFLPALLTACADTLTELEVDIDTAFESVYLETSTQLGLANLSRDTRMGICIPSPLLSALALLSLDTLTIRTAVSSGAMIGAMIGAAPVVELEGESASQSDRYRSSLPAAAHIVRAMGGEAPRTQWRAGRGRMLTDVHVHVACAMSGEVGVSEVDWTPLDLSLDDPLGYSGATPSSHPRITLHISGTTGQMPLPVARVIRELRENEGMVGMVRRGVVGVFVGEEFIGEGGDAGKLRLRLEDEDRDEEEMLGTVYARL